MAMSEDVLHLELERLAPPADPSGVVDRVLSRVRRRRALRRVQGAALAAVAIAGMTVGTYGLSRVSRPSGRLPDAVGAQGWASRGAASTLTTLRLAPGPVPVCDVSTVEGDFLGDAIPDIAYVFVLDAGTGTCPDPTQRSTLIGVQPDGRGPVSITFGPIDCPDGCRAFAAADIDGDGRAEIGVLGGQSGSTEVLTLYRVVDQAASGGGPAIEQVQISGPDGAAPLPSASSSSTYAAAAGSPCEPIGTPDGHVSAKDAASIDYLLARYRGWFAQADHRSGVRSGQAAALLTELARAAARQGLGSDAIGAIYQPSFSWGLNDPDGGGDLLRFLLRNPELLGRVLSSERSFQVDRSAPYFDMNPGAEYQSALLQEFPELHAAYSIMAEGRHPFARFWTTEGNLLPLATIAGWDDEVGRGAADVLRALQRGLRQFPDRNYFFVGGTYTGPRTYFSLRPDLAAFVRAWDPGASSASSVPSDACGAAV